MHPAGTFPSSQPGVPELISWLAQPERDLRQISARILYQRGVEQSAAAIRAWSSDPELASIFIREPSAPGQPEAWKVTVGVAVTPEHFVTIRAVNGSPHLADVPPGQDAIEFELRFEPQVRLDILTTKAPEGGGAIAKFLEKFGEGIQQVEYEVKDVDRAAEILRARFGQSPVYPQTRPGADGTRVNFFLAPAADGKKVLIELVEAP